MPLTPIAVAATVASSSAWAGFDAARKGLSGRIETVPLVVWLMLGQCPIFIAWWVASGFAPIAHGYWLPGLVDLTGNIIANLLFIRAVRIGELSTTIPLLSFTPVFTIGVAGTLLGELPGPLQGLGIVAVVVGAFALNLPGRFDLREWWARFRDNRGGHLMAVVAVIWSATASIDKLALSHAPVPFHAFFQCAGIAVTLTMYLGFKRELGGLGSIRTELPRYALAVALSVCAMGLQLVAIQMMYVSLVEAFKRAIGMAAATLNGRVFFGEPVTPQKLVAVVVMTVGVGLILVP